MAAKFLMVPAVQQWLKMTLAMDAVCKLDTERVRNILHRCWCCYQTCPAAADNSKALLPTDAALAQVATVWGCSTSLCLYSYCCQHSGVLLKGLSLQWSCSDMSLVAA